MLTQEQQHELNQYVPDSEMVRIVYADLHEGEEDFKDWEETVRQLVKKTIGEDGNIESLFNLMELIYLNAHNEGALETTVYEEG